MNKQIKKAPIKVVEKQRSLHTEHLSLISLLKGAKLDNPFDRLGMIAAPSGKGVTLRAWLPGAIGVELYALGAKTAMAQLHRR